MLAPLLLAKRGVPAQSSDVIVIGAGAAGLAAEALSRAGVSVVVLEARARAGGRILSRRVRGWAVPVELCAEFVHGRSEIVLRFQPAIEQIIASRLSPQKGNRDEIGFLHRRDAVFPTWWTAAPAQVSMLTSGQEARPRRRYGTCPAKKSRSGRLRRSAPFSM